DDSYCFLPGFDTEDLGPLIPGPTVTTINGGVEDGRILGNRILGPFTGPASLLGLEGQLRPHAIPLQRDAPAPLIVGNEITGAARAGVYLSARNIETATVSRNVIHDNGYGFLLGRIPPDVDEYFGAVITLNDITGSRIRAVGNGGSPAFYDRPS